MYQKKSIAVLALIILSAFDVVQGIWFPWYFQRYGLQSHNFRHKGGASGQHDVGSGRAGAGAAGNGGGGKKPTTSVTCPPGYRMRTGNGTQLKCDDNPVLMQLARLYIVSPERIMLLLTQPSVIDSCTEINDVLMHIRSSTSNCFLADDNIYGKLYNGLDYFKAEVCDGGNYNTRKRCADICDYHSCIAELRTDMIECEAPADWYERSNATKVCQIYNDILDCYYTRAAMLCGLEPARQLRSFAGDCMGRSLIHQCTMSKRLPRVDNPMPASAHFIHSIVIPFSLLAIAIALR